MTFESAFDLLAIIVSIFILIMLIGNYKMSKKVTKIINDTEKQNVKFLKFITGLMEILKDGSCSPIHKMLYDEMESRGPDKIMSIEEQRAFIKRKTMEFYNRDRQKAIDSIKSMQDPILKEKYEKRIQEADNIMTLIDTVDNDTPEEQVRIVMNSIAHSINIIHNIDRDIL